MSHAVSKARIRSETPVATCTRPKCKVEPYGLGRKNSLVGIAYRLHFQTYDVRCEKSTTWVTTGMERIALQTCHMKELGMEITNFFSPTFNIKTSDENATHEQIRLAVGITRRSEEDMESATLNANPLITRRCSNVSASDKIVALIGCSNVREISFSEVKSKLRTGRSSAVANNRVVKLHKEGSTGSQKIKKISPQWALRACNRPKPKLMAPVMQRERDDTIVSGNENPKRRPRLIQYPIMESAFLTNIYDFSDSTLSLADKSSNQSVTSSKESFLIRLPTMKTNSQANFNRRTISGTKLINKWEEKAMAPLTYGMKGLIFLEDGFMLQNYLNSLDVKFTHLIFYVLKTELLKRPANPKATFSRSRVISNLAYHEDYILKKAKILPAPLTGKRIEINLKQLLRDGAERYSKKLSFWQVFLKVLKVIALVLITMSLLTIGLLYGKSIKKWSILIYRVLFPFYWNLLKMFFSSPLL